MKLAIKKLSNILFFISPILLYTSCGGGDSDVIKDCSDGVYLPFQEKEDGRWGFINYTGDEVIPPEFKYPPTISSDGISMIKQYRDGEEFFDFIKIINSGTKYKIEELGMKLVNALPFSDGKTAIVENNSKIKYIDKNFKELFTLENIEYACSFSNGFAAVQNIDGKWGFINSKGKIAIKCQYDRVTKFNDNHALVVENDDYNIFVKLIDIRGKEVVDFKDKYNGYGLPSEGKVAVYDGSGWGFCNYIGEKVISINSSWSSVTNFRNGYASFEKDGDWGLIDSKGEVLIRSRYNNPLIFDNGLAPIIDEREVGFIDKEGTKVIRPTFNEIAYGFGCKNAIVKDGKYYIFIDKEGKQVNKNECRGIVQDPNYNNVRSRYMHRKFNGFIAGNQLEQTTLQSQFFDVESFVNSTIGNVSDILTYSTDITSSLENLGFNYNPESHVNGSGTYFHKKQFSEPNSIKPSNLSYSDVYIYFVDKVKTPYRNEYGYVAGYETNLHDPDNAVSKIKFKIKTKDKAYGKGSDIVAAIVSNISSLGYSAEEQNGSFRFTYDTGHDFAEVSYSSSYVYLTMYFLNDPDVDYSNP
ncbi:MAG: hypothetical protein CL846_07715 [Crocinitomicaceae bacterium]|nr:hypothetical protein [Crocinitomicaceae bacterium]|tara:strand:- start:437 stop:2182 length:1746 start_codon:yes stop_codon:yes gene_type:complete